MGKKFEKGQKCRLQNLTGKAKHLNNTKVKILEVKEDSAVVRTTDGTNNRYEVPFENLKPCAVKPAVAPAASEIELELEPETTAELEPEEVEEVVEEEVEAAAEEVVDPYAVGTFHRLTNCKDENLNGKLVVIRERLEDQRLLVQDKREKRFKVSEGKLKPSKKSFYYEGAPEEVPAEADAEEILSIDQLIEQGHPNYILQGCSDEKLNDKICTLDSVCEDGKIRVRIIGDSCEYNGRCAKVDKDKLLPIIIEQEEQPASPNGDSSDEVSITKSELQRLLNLDHMVQGIPEEDLVQLITAYMNDEIVYKSDIAAAVAAEAGEAQQPAQVPAAESAGENSPVVPPAAEEKE